MKRITKKRFSMAEMIGVITVMILGISVYSYAVTVPTIFTPETTAKADEVNANFKALVDAVTALESTVATLQANQAAIQSDVTTAQGDISTAQSDISTLQGNSVLALDGLLTLDSSSGFDTALFAGVNVQVHNGVAQDTVNGLGNLIVGFNNDRLTNEVGGALADVCSNGRYDNQMDCEANGDVWDTNHKTGSHNLIAGDENAYSSTGGVVFGRFNASNRLYAGVTGGQENLATGLDSNVSGGLSNVASGFYSSVSGGLSNIASGDYSGVSGGIGNTASGDNSSVSGGLSNIVSGFVASVSGGLSNVASGFYSSVSGGQNNLASGDYSSVSGGSSRMAVNQDNWVAGTLLEDN